MKFRFPIVVFDEDFHTENTSGLGIRALATAIEAEGWEVLDATSYGDLSQFAQQQSRASAFILSVDDEEFSAGPDLDPVVLNLRNFIQEARRKNTDVPIYVYGGTKTSRHMPNDVLRELHGFLHPQVRGHARVRCAPYHPQSERRPGGYPAVVLPHVARQCGGRLGKIATNIRMHRTQLYWV